MLRNIKALGLALVAVLAMSALVASAASAEITGFHSSAKKTTISASQVGEHEFVVNTGVVVCKNAEFEGEVEGEEVGEGTYVSESVTVHPEYSECEFEELFEVSVNTEGCHYTFTAVDSTDGKVSIDCGEGGYIQVGSVFTCRVRVPTQPKLATVTFHPNVKHIDVTAHVTGIEYEESGLFCSGSGGVNGTYEGVTTVKGNGGEATLSVTDPEE